MFHCPLHIKMYSVKLKCDVHDFVYYGFLMASAM